jgi:hypothetical protein
METWPVSSSERGNFFATAKYRAAFITLKLAARKKSAEEACDRNGTDKAISMWMSKPTVDSFG